jgi:hypothetical protein
MVSGLPGSRYEVAAAASDASFGGPGAAQLSAQVAAIGTMDLRVTMRTLGSLQGTLVVTEGALPGSVQLSLGEAEPRSVAVSGGRFVVQDLAPGRTTLALRADGFVPLRRDLTILSDQPSELGELLLRRGPSVRGAVLDSGGSPVPAAHVVASARIVGDASDLHASTLGWEAYTDERGEFQLEGLPATSVFVMAAHPARSRSALQSVSAGNADSGPIHLTVGLGSRLRGVVTRGAQPLQGVAVAAAYLTEGRDALALGVTSDAEGRYELPELPFGKYLVSAYAQVGADSKSAPIQTVDLSTKAADTTVDIQFASDAGKLTLLAVPGRSVAVQLSGPELHELRVVGESSVLENISAGSYQLCVGGSRCMPVHLKQGEEQTVQLALLLTETNP